ncbi:BspA family leucine-rich repeat surface protein [Flavobacterium sp. GA093]|uniref:BspA family leucine-rich repeat surface protein n=1 Tax=Flavobacterium hydrocarbonoxydans TaxID=2683249 RepID=A0A6I4NQQ4_9FLAO|nr:BspA family leucine-rich repeat surface protein [Flavobacterium hydrocarbonoxydans]MWB96768.1 BspA family leucine-rich repeat surface protein [Flavobacterium hydrocarbonoxydans]
MDTYINTLFSRSKTKFKPVKRILKRNFTDLAQNNFLRKSKKNIFESVWKTNNISSGSSASTQIKLPLIATGTYDFVVDWGDGSSNKITSYNHPNTTHTYAISGTYTIKIEGTCTGWQFDNSGDRLKILSIRTWGSAFRLGTNQGNYFFGCDNLNLATVKDVLNLSGTTHLNFAFSNCTALTEIRKINNWNTSGVGDMCGMFSGCTFFNQNLDLWNTTAVTNMSSMFRSCSSFNQNLGNWNVSAVFDFSNMFYDCTVFNNGGSCNINNWKIRSSGNIDMSDMFSECNAFNQNIGNWNTIAVTTMNKMFSGCTAFNQNIENWNTTAVTNMFAMFRNCSRFNQNIEKWNTAAVTTMYGMFLNCSSFNQNIGNWNTAAVTNMGGMFWECTDFNQNIENWNTTLVTNMNGMFYGAVNFDQNLGNWNVATVTDFSTMFSGCKHFNNGGSPDINNWKLKTTAVVAMYNMFKNCSSFNQNIENWNVSSSNLPKKNQ